MPSQARAWAELLRVSALFTVPGDALAGAAATRTAPNRGTALAVGASLCLYEAGMALNDWADRDTDAVERPRRPLPSGRITPAAALTAATGLTAAGLLCAAPAGRRALATAVALAGTVWAYDLGLKNTPAGPYAMATARSLDLLLGATATYAPAARQAVAPAALLGAHTLAVTAVSRHEATGGSSKPPAAALATAAAIAWTATRRRPRPDATPSATPSAAPRAADPRPGWTRAPARWSAARTTSRAPAVTPRPGLGPAVGGRAGAGAAAGLARALVRRAPSAPRGGRSARRPTLRGLAAMAIRAASPGRAPATSPRPIPTAGARSAATATAAAAGPRPSRTRLLARRAAGPLSDGPSVPGRSPAVRPALPGSAARPGPHLAPAHGLASAALAGTYLATAARPLAHAALNPSPHLLQRAVGSGIRAMIPLQAALASRAGAGRSGAGLLLLMPVARRLSRKVSPT